MAYVPTFSAIDDELQRQKQLAGEAGGGDAGSPSAGGGGSGSPTSATGAPSYTQSNYASGKKILDANKNETLGFDITKPYQEEIQNAGAGEAKGWDDYTNAANAEKAKGSINQGDIDLAAGGDADATKRINDARTSSYAATTYSPYGAPDIVNQVGQLGSSQGIQTALQKEQEKRGVSDYGTGMSALDAVIYGRRPETQAQIQNVGKQASDFKNLIGAHTAQFQADNGIDPNTGKPIAGGGNLQQAITSNKAATDAQINAYLDQIRNNPSANTDDIRSQAQKAALPGATTQVKSALIAKANEQSDPTVRQYYLDQANSFDTSDANIMKYLQDNSPANAGGNYTTDQATKFNTLEKLIGGTTNLTGITPGDYTFGINNNAVNATAKDMSAQAQAKLDKENADKATADALARKPAEEAYIKGALSTYQSSHTNPNQTERDRDIIAKSPKDSVMYKEAKARQDQAAADLAAYEKQLRDYVSKNGVPTGGGQQKWTTQVFGNPGSPNIPGPGNIAHGY